LAASDEVKAIETMSLAAGVEPAVIHIDGRFGEVHRRGEPFDDNHRARRRAWVEGRPDDRHDSWETPEQAGHRFQRGLDDLDADVVAVASHGMVITSWLVLIGQVPRGNAAGDFWENLAFPDVVTVAT
jgi:broad specificity phosphatase PhoE